MMQPDPYREADAAYQAAGQHEGLKKLANDFYQLMDSRPEFKLIRDLHHEDLDLASEKLGLFLCGYFNGPHLYAEKYGQFHLAAFHQKVAIGTPERDAWLTCMQLTLDKQPWDQAFKDHVIQRLCTPAERCRNLP